MREALWLMAASTLPQENLKTGHNSRLQGAIGRSEASFAHVFNAFAVSVDHHAKAHGLNPGVSETHTHLRNLCRTIN